MMLNVHVLLDNWVINHNGKPLMWKTGHSLIKAKLHESDAKIAAEMSGHFYFQDRWFGFDDALYAAARLLEILSQESDSSDRIFSSLPDSINTPELRVKIDDEEKFNFIEKFKAHATFKDGRITTLDGVRVDFNFGFGLIRASNTTPCLILRFEADTKQNLLSIQEMFRKQIVMIEPQLSLPF